MFSLPFFLWYFSFRPFSFIFYLPFLITFIFFHDLISFVPISRSIWYLICNFWGITQIDNHYSKTVFIWKREKQNPGRPTSSRPGRAAGRAPARMTRPLAGPGWGVGREGGRVSRPRAGPLGHPPSLRPSLGRPKAGSFGLVPGLQPRLAGLRPACQGLFFPFQIKNRFLNNGYLFE